MTDEVPPGTLPESIPDYLDYMQGRIDGLQEVLRVVVNAMSNGDPFVAEHLQNRISNLRIPDGTGRFTVAGRFEVYNEFAGDVDD